MNAVWEKREVTRPVVHVTQWRWGCQEQRTPQGAGGREDLSSPRHHRGFNLLDAGSSFLGESRALSEPTSGLKVSAERKDWIHSNGCIMINTAILLLLQSSCLCLTAFILSLWERRQLASGHGEIFVASEYKYSHQWMHLSGFCLNSAFQLKCIWLWVKREQHLRKKSDVLKGAKLHYRTVGLLVSLRNLIPFLYKNYSMQLHVSIIFDSEHLAHVWKITGDIFWEWGGKAVVERWMQETKHDLLPASSFSDLLCTSLININ